MLNATQKIPKVNVPNLVTPLNWTLVFEWYVVGCGSKNGYQKDTCQKRLDYILFKLHT